MIKRPKANIQDSSPMYGFDPKIGFWGLRNLKHKAYFDYEIENPIDVYHNGQHLRSGSNQDYLLVSTNSIRFNFLLEIDDSILVIVF